MPDCEVFLPAFKERRPVLGPQRVAPRLDVVGSRLSGTFAGEPYSVVNVVRIRSSTRDARVGELETNRDAPEPTV